MNYTGARPERSRRDGAGLRVQKSSGTLYWRSYSGQVLEETDTSGNMQRDYIFFAGRRVAWKDSSGNVYYYFADAIGSTRAVTNSSGTTCFEADYYPYGQENDYNTSCSPTYKFTGYEFDSETGNYYAYARYYDPSIGRFLSADPLGGDISNPQSLNRYAYVMNNPETFAGPFGACGADNPCPPPPSTGPEPTDPWATCTIDGTPADCGFAYAMEGAGGIVQCDFCDVPFMGPDGDGWVQIGVGALGDMFYSYNYAGNDHFVSELQGFPSLSWYSDYSWAAGPVPSSDGSGGGAPVDKHGVPCRTKILGRFNAQFHLNVSQSSVVEVGAPGYGGITDNIDIYFPSGSLATGVVQPGRYGGWPLGLGSTLHVVTWTVGPSPFAPGQLADIAQVHLDQGNPFILPLGPLSHLDYALFHSAGPCP